MDLYKAIRDLQREKRRLDRVIETLEGVIRNGSKANARVKRRGRKGMSAQERKAVSERMRNYWATRRAGPQESASGESASMS